MMSSSYILRGISSNDLSKGINPFNHPFHHNPNPTTNLQPCEKIAFFYEQNCASQNKMCLMPAALQMPK